MEILGGCISIHQVLTFKLRSISISTAPGSPAEEDRDFESITGRNHRVRKRRQVATDLSAKKKSTDPKAKIFGPWNLHLVFGMSETSPQISTNIIHKYYPQMSTSIHKYLQIFTDIHHQYLQISIHLQDIHKISTKYPQNIQKISTKYPQNIH